MMSDEKNIDDMATIIGGGFNVNDLKKAVAEKQAVPKPVDDMATVVGGGLTVDQLKKAVAEKKAAEAKDSKSLDDMVTIVGGGLTVDQLRKAVAEKQTVSLENQEQPKAQVWEDPSNKITSSQSTSNKTEEPKKGFLARLMAWLFG